MEYRLFLWNEQPSEEEGKDFVHNADLSCYVTARDGPLPRKGEALRFSQREAPYGIVQYVVFDIAYPIGISMEDLTAPGPVKTVLQDLAVVKAYRA
jgi:hypothetical protein